MIQCNNKLILNVLLKSAICYISSIVTYTTGNIANKAVFKLHFNYLLFCLLVLFSYNSNAHCIAVFTKRYRASQHNEERQKLRDIAYQSLLPRASMQRLPFAAVWEPIDLQTMPFITPIIYLCWSVADKHKPREYKKTNTQQKLKYHGACKKSIEKQS